MAAPTLTSNRAERAERIAQFAERMAQLAEHSGPNSR